MKRIFVAAFLAALISACGGNADHKATSQDSASAAVSDTNKVKVEAYGDAITEDSAVAISELSTLMGDKKELKLKLTGEIEGVCQKKGCWMDIKNPSGEAVHVTFKDYGFFMPKDAAGRTAIMEGVASVEEVSVADLQEIAKDAGKSDAEVKAIKEPQKKLVFEANGVILK